MKLLLGKKNASVNRGRECTNAAQRIILLYASSVDKPNRFLASWRYMLRRAMHVTSFPVQKGIFSPPVRVNEGEM